MWDISAPEAFNTQSRKRTGRVAEVEHEGKERQVKCVWTGTSHTAEGSQQYQQHHRAVPTYKHVTVAAGGVRRASGLRA